jgi:hypothetical protein
MAMPAALVGVTELLRRPRRRSFLLLTPAPGGGGRVRG